MPIDRSAESEKFIQFVKSTFQSFDVEGFYTRSYIKPLTKSLTKPLTTKGEDLKCLEKIGVKRSKEE
jgi:hypothetical protein